MAEIGADGTVSPRGYMWRGGKSDTIDVVIVGDSWTQTSAAAGTPIPRPGFDMIKMLLQENGIPLDRVYITNAVPTIRRGAAATTSKEVDTYVDLLYDDIRALNPKIVVACGSNAIYALARKKAPITELRGQVAWNPEIQVQVLMTLHPGGFRHNPTGFKDFSNDFEKIQYVMALPRGPVGVDKPDIEIIWNREAFFESAWPQLVHADDGVIAVDIETDGFDPFRDDILSIGFQVTERKSLILSKACCEDAEVQASLEQLFGSPKFEFVYQNGKFDVKHMRANPDPEIFGKKKKVVISNARCDFDTMLAHYCLDATQGTHGLKVWAREEFFAPDWDSGLKEYLPTKSTPYSAIPESILYEYQAYDTYYTRKGRYLFKEKLQRDGTWDAFLSVYTEALPAFTEVELEGIPIDRDRLQEIYESAQPTIQAAKEKLISLAEEVGWDPQVYAAKRYEESMKKWLRENAHLTPEKRKKQPGKPEEPKFFNPASHPQLSYVAYDLCGMPLFEGKKTCDKFAVEEYRHRHAFWQGLFEYKQVTDLYGTFIKGMLERTEADNRIRPDFLLHGTRTGRISCTNPNMQNLPRSSNIKDFFVADPGCVVVNADYKTLEVVVASVLSQDEEMQRPFLEGKDFHTETTRAVFGEEVEKLQESVRLESRAYFEEQLSRSLMMEIREDVLAKLDQGDYEHAYQRVWSHMRFLTKFITFGIMYGRGAESLAKGELNCSIREATAYIKQFFGRYPKFKTWLDQQEHKAIHEGYVQTAFGFKRRWPLVTPDNAHEVKNQAWNTPVQGTAGQLCVMALARAHKKLKETGWGRVLFTVHDSIVFSISEEHLGKALHYLYSEMVAPVLDSPVPLEVEFEVGPTYKKVEPVILLDNNKWQFEEEAA